MEWYYATPTATYESSWNLSTQGITLSTLLYANYVSLNTTSFSYDSNYLRYVTYANNILSARDYCIRTNNKVMWMAVGY